MLKSRAVERSASDESVEAVRRRARYRLVGALVLVMIGVVGFPLVFDTQPRPVDQDLAIIIPDKNQVAALVVSDKPLVAAAPDASAPVVAPVNKGSADTEVPAKADAPNEGAVQAKADTPPASRKPDPAPVQRSEPKAAGQPDAKPIAAPAPAPKSEPTPPAAVVSSANANDAARAKAILEGRSAATVKSDGPWVVQVGAYSDDASVNRVRRMLEAGGLKTYTQAVPTSAGVVTRVRLGPYDNNDAALKAQAKAKTLGFTGAKVLKP